VFNTTGAPSTLWSASALHTSIIVTRFPPRAAFSASALPTALHWTRRLQCERRDGSDLDELSQRVSRPPASRIAAWLSSVLPLSGQSVVVLAEALTTEGGLVASPTRGCPFNVSADNASSAISVPVYFLQMSALAQALRYESSTSLCIAATAAAEFRASQFMGAISQPSSNLQFQFRLILGDAPMPGFMPAATIYGTAVDIDVISQQASLRSSTQWPGVPLSTLSAAMTLNTTLTLSSLVGNGRNITLVLFTVDGRAAVGVAYALVLLAPPVTGATVNGTLTSVSVSAVSKFVQNAAASLTPAAAALNPFGTLLTVGSLAGLLLNGSSTAAISTGSFDATSLQQLTLRNIAARDSLLGALDAAIGTLGRANASTLVQIDDNTVTTTSNALLSLTQDALELSPSSRVLASSTLCVLLLGALPSQSGTVSATTGPVTAFPLPTANMAMGVIVNVLTASVQINVSSPLAQSQGGGIDANVANGLAAALSATAAAVLRAASPDDNATTLSAGPQAAFASGNDTASYCGPAMSMTAARATSGADITVPVGRPLLRCFQYQ